MNIKAIIVTILIYSSGYSQKVQEFFFPLDTITLQKPIILSLKDYSGEFVMELSKFDKSYLSKQKILDSEDVYLYFFNPYWLYDDTNFIYGDQTCEIISNPNLPYDYFVKEEIKFIVGLIKLSKYDSIMKNPNNSKTIFSKESSKCYYTIIFPLCNDNILND